MANYRLRIGASTSFVLAAESGNYTLTGIDVLFDLEPAPGGAGMLTWTAATGATGYRVYWDTMSGPPYSNSQDVGSVLTYPAASLTGIGTGTRYLNIRSYDESGLEGPWGTEIQVTL